MVVVARCTSCVVVACKYYTKHEAPYVLPGLMEDSYQATARRLSPEIVISAEIPISCSLQVAVSPRGLQYITHVTDSVHMSVHTHAHAMRATPARPRGTLPARAIGGSPGDGGGSRLLLLAVAVWLAPAGG